MAETKQPTKIKHRAQNGPKREPREQRDVMPTVYGYVHFAVGSQQIEQDKERLAAAGASKILVEKLVPFHPKKQPVLAELINSAKKGDSLIVSRLYHLAPQLGTLFRAVVDLKNAGVDLISLDDGLYTRQPNGERIYTVFDALQTFVRDYDLRHNGERLHIFENGGGGGDG